MTVVIAASLLLFGQMTGKVVSVTDGDTITIRSEEKTIKVRLKHIDAPERGQAFGARSRQELGDMVFGKVVEVFGESKDRYGRVLGEVEVDGTNVNLRMVKLGFAWAYTDFRPPAEYFSAQRDAMRERLGLWAESDPMPPWIFRKSKR